MPEILNPTPQTPKPALKPTESRSSFRLELSETHEQVCSQGRVCLVSLPIHHEVYSMAVCNYLARWGPQKAPELFVQNPKPCKKRGLKIYHHYFRGFLMISIL